MTEIELVNYLLNKMLIERLSFDEYRNLQYFLIKNYVNYKFNFPVTETFIDDYSLIWISDTHIGSEYENSKFIYSAYNYAISNNIKTVIHLGGFN